MRSLLLDAVFPWWAFIPLALGITWASFNIYWLVRDLMRDAERRRKRAALRREREVRRETVLRPANPRCRSVLVDVSSVPVSSPNRGRAGELAVREPRICVQQVDPVARRRYREARQEAEARAALYPRDGALCVLPVNTYAPAAGTGRGV